MRIPSGQLRHHTSTLMDLENPRSSGASSTAASRRVSLAGAIQGVASQFKALWACPSWWTDVPLGCRWLLGLCVVCTLWFNSGDVCLKLPPTMLSMLSLPFAREWFLSPLCHAGWLHLLMNGVALLSIGASVEQRVGTHRWCVLVAALIFACNAMFLLLQWLATFHLSQHLSCVVGCSGLLFALMTYEAWHPGARRDAMVLFCGWWPVRATVAPLVLLGVVYLLLPSSSFLMHLCGVVAGAAFATVASVERTLSAVLRWMGCPTGSGSRGGSSLCTRCRHFEEGAAEQELSGATSNTNAHNSDAMSAWSRLPGIHPSAKDFEPFSGRGRRLGDMGPSAAAPSIVPEAVTTAVGPSAAGAGDVPLVAEGNSGHTDDLPQGVPSSAPREIV